tara:strand:+ start:5278 stop:6048 length:771 start_codon:yes stop_codon:yes gene_type:complete
MALSVENFLKIIRKAGEEVLEIEKTGDFQVTEKGADDPLTRADLIANEILSELQGEVNGSFFYSEESVEKPGRQEADFVWIVDPIDGTREFIQNIPEYALSVALVRRGRILFSCVYNPHHSLAYMVEGKGLTIETVDDPVELGGEGFCVSRSEYDRGLFEPLGSHLEFHRVGSIAFKLSLVAQGVYPACISLRPKHEWDIAGGVGLVEASRKSVCDIYGRKFQWNSGMSLDGVVAGTDETVRGLFADKPLVHYFKV